MRQAIVTKYLGPTNYKCARIKAFADAGSVTVNWDYALNVEDNHWRAALTLAAKFNWGDTRNAWIGGGMPDNTPYAFCFVQPV